MLRAFRLPTLPWLCATTALLTLSMPLPGLAQAVMPQATGAVRSQQRQQQVRQILPENFDLSLYPPDAAHQDYWENLLWTTAVVEPQEPFVDTAIGYLVGMASHSGLSTEQADLVKAAMQVGTQLYLSNPTGYERVAQGFVFTLERSSNPEWVAMALSALVRAGASPEQRLQWRSQVQQRFPRWAEQIHLYTTLRELEEIDRPSPLPPLEELLNWSIAPDELHLFALCPPDRGELCRLVLRDRQGQFVRRNGELWSVQVSVRSLHNLSWNFTRGHTPQGIYRIEGIRPPNLDLFRAYGQFSLVKLFVPFERGVREFIPGQAGTLAGGLAGYQALLPPSWRNYYPIQQSFWAGTAGRGLFRIHGSGESPGFFTNNQRYPNSMGWNPTIGCVSALELYDETGRLYQADMPVILGALRTIDGEDFSGYLVVVDVPTATSQSLSLNQIEGMVNSNQVSSQP